MTQIELAALNVDEVEWLYILVTPSGLGLTTDETRDWLAEEWPYVVNGLAAALGIDRPTEIDFAWELAKKGSASLFPSPKFRETALWIQPNEYVHLEILSRVLPGATLFEPKPTMVLMPSIERLVAMWRLSDEGD